MHPYEQADQAILEEADLVEKALITVIEKMRSNARNRGSNVSNSWVASGLKRALDAKVKDLLESMDDR